MRKTRSVAPACVSFVALGFLAMSASLLAADIGPMLNRAAAAAKSGDQPAAIEALEQALEKVRFEAPLTLKPFVVVSRPAKIFGDIEARANTTFGVGEKQNFYLEPKNLVLTRADSGIYEPAFEVDLEIVASDGQVIAKQPRFGSFRLPTRRPVQDLFMNLNVTMSGVPAGAYKVKFVVRDLNSKKTATAEQPITIR